MPHAKAWKKQKLRQKPEEKINAQQQHIDHWVIHHPGFQERLQREFSKKEAKTKDMEHEL